MIITLIQQQLRWGDRAHNLSVFGRIAQEHSGKSDLLVFPEMFSTGFCVNNPSLAETMQGETMTLLKEWAQKGQFAIVGSLMIRVGENHFNRGFFIHPNGEIEYADKRHLFIGSEQRIFTAGDKKLTVHYKGFHIRLIICYDVRFPVWCRCVNNDYDLLVAVANFPEERIEVWDLLLQARAHENQSYVCGVNCIGTDLYNHHHNGHSQLIDPRGKRLITFEENAIGSKSIEISPELVASVREKAPFQRDADAFTLL